MNMIKVLAKRNTISGGENVHRTAPLSARLGNHARARVSQLSTAPFQHDSTVYEGGRAVCADTTMNDP